MWRVGFMVWRIGAILDLDAQIEWVREAGFDGIGLHASPGVTGQWQGTDPATLGLDGRRRLRRQLSTFDWREIHAPFEIVLKPATMPAMVECLTPVIQFAADVGATVVTVHGEPPADTSDGVDTWQQGLDQLNMLAATVNITLGLELMRGFEWLATPHRGNIGITLDVGHMYLNDGQGYRPYGSLGALVRTLDQTLAHVHVHDYDGTHDHMELGTGCVGFNELLDNLLAIGYRGGLCLELNPDRVSPEGIRRSLLRLKSGNIPQIAKHSLLPP